LTSQLGRALSIARQKRRWTLREAAKQTGVHNAHLSQIEKGVILRPSPSVLFQVAQVYGLRFDELLKMAGYAEGETSPAVSVAFQALMGMSPDLQEQAARYVLRLKGGEATDGERRG
jgi:transcriptional regulator with XRE-family HTH domain